MFLAFEGIDGSGKSTQVRLLAEWLSEQGRAVTTCRDPGSTPLGEKIRSLLLTHSELAIGMRSEMLLYMAARAQLVEQVIGPVCDQGHDVVSDRFLLSNVVYQGYAGGLDPHEIWQVGLVATDHRLPDLTFLLDLPVEAARSRQQEQPDRVEVRGEAFLGRVREGFLAEAAKWPDGVIVLDACQSPEQIHAGVRRALCERLLRHTGENENQ